MQVAHLQQQNNHLRQKYQKSLQQLMNILKVNKSLKDYLEQRRKDNQSHLHQRVQHDTQMLGNVQQRNKVYVEYEKQLRLIRAQLDKQRQLRSQLQAQNGRLVQGISHLQQANQHLHRQLMTMQGRLHGLQAIIQKTAGSLEPTLNTTTIQIENEHRKHSSHSTHHIQHLQNKYLNEQISRLKEDRNQLTTQLFQKKQRAREEIRRMEETWNKEREALNHSLQQAQTQLMIARRDTTEFSHLQSFLEQNQENEKQQLLQTIKIQLQKVTLQLGKQSNPNTSQVKTLSPLQLQLHKVRQQMQKANFALDRRINLQKSSQIMKAQMTDLQFCNVQLQSNNVQLQKRLHILQALHMTDRYRNDQGFPQRMQEFQNRIQLLFEHPEEYMANSLQAFHQILVLKGYIVQLCQGLNHAQLQIQHQTKRADRNKAKFIQSRNKLQECEGVMKHNAQVYQKRIKDYQQLFNRICQATQTGEIKVPGSLQKAVEVALEHYQHKMIEMSKSIMILQNQNEELQRQNQQRMHKDTHILAKSQSHLDMSKSIEIKNAQNVQNQIMKIQQQHQQEIQQKNRIIKNLTQNSIYVASLVQKLNYLQFKLKQKQTQQKTQNTGNIQQLVHQRALFTITQLQQKLISAQKQTDQIKTSFFKAQQFYREEMSMMTRQNNSLVQQLQSKHQEMMEYYNQLNKKLEEENKYLGRLETMEQMIEDIDKERNQIVQQSTSEINQLRSQLVNSSQETTQLSSQLVTLRTTNLSLRKDLQQKDTQIDQLKHNIFVASLKTQKESMSRSFIKSQQDQNNKALTVKLQQNTRALSLKLSMAQSQNQALRSKNQALQRMYSEDLDKYKEALNQLQAKQMELSYSLLYTNTEKRITEMEIPTMKLLQDSKEAISEQGTHSRLEIQATELKLFNQNEVRNLNQSQGRIPSQTQGVNIRYHPMPAISGVNRGYTTYESDNLSPSRGNSQVIRMANGEVLRRIY